MTSAFERLKRFLPKSGPLADGLVQRIALGVAVVVITAVPVVVTTPPVGLVEGKPAPRTYRANRQVQFEDAEATEQLRQAAEEAVEPVLRFDVDSRSRAQERVRSFFAAVAPYEIRAAVAAEEASRAVSPASETSPAAVPAEDSAAKRPAPEVDRTPDIPAIARAHQLEEDTVQSAAALDEDEWREASRVTEEIVGTLMTARFDRESLPDVELRLRESARIVDLSDRVRHVVVEVGVSSLAPTVHEDEAATAAARTAAVAEVSPVVVVKQAGENIVMRGEVVTQRHLQIMASLGLLEGGSEMQVVASVVALLVMIVAVIGFYLAFYERKVYDRMRELAVVASLFVGMVVVTRAVLWLFPEASPYVMPVPLAAMLATLLISPRIGLVVALATSAAGLLLGFTTGANAVAVLVASLTAIAAMSRLTERRHLVYAGFAVVIALSVAAAVATLASGSDTQAALAALLYGAAGGAMSSVLAVGLLPFFEHLFGVTTDVRLLELSSPAAPLLRELMSKAPGTYSHSVLAGSLAETAADAIGANPLLARVGAYYHDLGKMNRPVFFAENLNGAENPHDEKTPWLSASIITAHVRDGIEIAERHGLPGEIVDIIRQHHGDSLVAYFYSKAAGSGQPVYEADFRYSGQRPKSPEAALVMLADSVEAAIRSTRPPTLSEVESEVRKVVREKADDGQLDDSALTLADIETVIGVYARMLVSIYHPRVQYPENPIRRGQDARQRYEPSRP